LSSQRRKILVADGDEIVVALISHLLDHQGYSVDIARTADEAANRLNNDQYAAVLLDSAFSRALLTAPQVTPCTILFSARTTDTELPVHTIILKPIELQLLIDSVKACTKESGE
jgi:CheY-like chemotaxis protein